MAKKLEKKGAPAYMVTLGDMWSLMLTFFIMLFAMSQIDATQFKKVEGSIKTTFGYRQQNLLYGPPPGINPIQASSKSNHFPDDIIFDQAQDNSINDPEFAARKVSSCEKKNKKDIQNRVIARRNGERILQSLEREIDQGVFNFEIVDNKISLVFSQTQGFDRNDDLRKSVVEALRKLGTTLESIDGAITVRGLIPTGFDSAAKSAFQDVATQQFMISSGLTQNRQAKLQPRIKYETVMSDSPKETLFEILITKE